MKKILIFLFLSISICSNAQKPKLVVGIIVDQMRQEYLLRFGSRFQEGGFKRLISEGYMFKNAHFNYIPTYTAPGHTSVYTGTTPANHGIIGNHWYDRAGKAEVYCAYDTEVATVGAKSESGLMSPKRLMVTTITDELRFSNQMASKVIGISIKDRGAIFPAGHTGQAYWHDRDNGRFITSTYYRQKLPDWVEKFNKRKLPDKYLKQTWETLYPIDTYTASGADATEYEGKLAGQTTFPYDLTKVTDSKHEYLPTTPFGNDLLTDMAVAAIDGESLGKGDHTDFLAVSFSATDYIGHRFGPNSVEVEDTYLRLDRNIKTLLEILDKAVGKGNYLVFLTADHAVVDVPQYLKDSKAPGGYFEVDLAEDLNAMLTDKYGVGEWIESITNLQVFLNRELLNSKGLDLREVQTMVSDYILNLEGVATSYPAHVVNDGTYERATIKGLLIKGYNLTRSGDVLFTLQSGWLYSDSKTGTSHGTGFTYDTHVPMLWYGSGIKPGVSVKYHPITDIAPTLSMMLDIKLPSAATGQPLTELFE